MFCIKCGTQLPDAANFCSKCGYNVRGEEPHEEYKNITTIAKETDEIKKTSFKMQNKILGITVISLILVLHIGFVAKDDIVYAISQEKHIFSAINETYKSLQKDLANMESMFIGKTFTEGSYSRDIGLLVKNIKHTDPWINNDLHGFSGIGIELATSVDRDSKELHFNGKSIYNGMDFLSLGAKLDDMELILSVRNYMIRLL